MPWAKFDDRYDDTRKIKRAWKASKATVGLHAMAITYCSRHQTDGVVDLDWVLERVQSMRECTKLIEKMVDLRLFDPIDDTHWLVHDYLEYNDSKANRKAKSDQGKAAAEARWDAERIGGADAERNADGIADRNAVPDASPHHTTPHPSTPSLVEGGDPEVGRLSHLLADLIVSRAPTAKVAPGSDRWLKSMRLLVADVNGDTAAVERVLRWSQADSFWSTNILSPDKLRTRFTQLSLKMAQGTNGAAAEMSTAEWLAAWNGKPAA